MRRGASLALALGLLLAACQSGAAPGPSLTVYAAASLQAALATVGPAYATTHPGTTIMVSTDSSAALEVKLEQGAPADLFLSADTANPGKLVDRGLAEAVTPFATNRLTIVVPTGNPAHLATAADLARPGVRVVAAGESVPITRYAEQLVAQLAQSSRDPGLAAAYEANIVSREDNVAAVLAKIALGDGDAAIVYATDARASTGVATIPLPDGVKVVATYGGAVLAASPQRRAAAAFLAWLAGPEGRSALTGFGFGPAA